MIALIPLPRQFYTAVTFPGVVVRQVVTQAFCRLLRLAVHDLCYLSIDDEPAGHVKYEPTPTVAGRVAVTVGPWVVCSLVAATIALPAATRLSVLGGGSTLDALFVWLSISIAMHALPTSEETASLMAAVEGRGVSTLSQVCMLPLAALMGLGVLLSCVMEGLLYGLLVAFGVPALVVHLLA